MTFREAAGELRWVQLLPLLPTGSECGLTLPSFTKASVRKTSPLCLCLSQEEPSPVHPALTTCW